MKSQPLLDELVALPIPQIAEPLLGWYDAGARILPWRSEPTPYRVWVSEIMLQQTRVAAVLPYFERFLAALPTIPSLAQVDPETLHKLWEGLGYYSRVRNLQRAAQMVCEFYEGELPASYEALLALPGIGEYTAGAIASIAFGLSVPAVDGNVLRVFSRLLAFEGDVLEPAAKRAFQKIVAATLPPHRPGDYNQALMELGATLCGPGGAPKCEGCPLKNLCRGRELEIAAGLPLKAKKAPRKILPRTLLLLTWEGRVLVQKRPESGLLAGLWEFPGREGALTPEEVAAWGGELAPLSTPTPLGGGKHIFTHLEWHMTGWTAEALAPPTLGEGQALVSLAQLREGYTLPSAFATYTKLLPRLLGEEETR